MDLRNKTVVLIGASGGVGIALKNELENSGAKIIPISKSLGFDLTKKEDLEKLITKVKSEYGQVDILINAAGIGTYKNLTDITLDEWDYLMALNLTAPFVLIKELLPKSLVLTVGSGAGVIPMRGRSGYCASKFGLRGLMLSLAEEYKDKEPKFCLITLGSTLTNFGPLTLEQKLEKHKNGDAYFTTEWVAKKLIEIIENDNRETEIILYPGDFGFGTWKKP